MENRKFFKCPTPNWGEIAPQEFHKDQINPDHTQQSRSHIPGTSIKSHMPSQTCTEFKLNVTAESQCDTSGAVVFKIPLKIWSWTALLTVKMLNRKAFTANSIRYHFIGKYIQMMHIFFSKTWCSYLRPSQNFMFHSWTQSSIYEEELALSHCKLSQTL